MFVYIARRLFQSVIALILLSMVVFLLIRTTGDPAALMLPPEAPPEYVEELRISLGLDKPIHVQYGIFLINALKGDFGKTFRARRPAIEIVMECLPNSVKLSACSVGVAILIAFPLGVIAGVRRGTSIDKFAQIIAVLGQSLPTFWVGIVFIELFTGYLKILPAGGIHGPSSYILPSLTMGWAVVAGLMRLLRSSMIEAMDSEYIKLARIKGASEMAIIWKHALKNSLIPVLTFAALYFALLITIAIVVETVFAWPGVGRLVYLAIVDRDFPLIQAIVLISAAIVIFVNLLVDIFYSYLDPRIRIT